MNAKIALDITAGRRKIASVNTITNWIIVKCKMYKMMNLSAQLVIQIFTGILILKNASITKSIYAKLSCKIALQTVKSVITTVIWMDKNVCYILIPFA